MSDATIITNLKLQSQQYVSGMKQAIETTKGLGNQVSGLSSKFSTLQKVTAALATGAMALAVKNGMNAAQQYRQLAVAFNTSTESIQAMRQMALRAGGDFNQLMGAAEQLSERIGEAFIQKSGAAYDALSAMGLKADELSKMPLDQSMRKIAERIDQMNLTTAEATFLLAELGISGKELVPMFLDGGVAMDEAAAAAARFGGAISDMEASSIADANRSLGEFNNYLEGLVNDFNVAFAPAITAVSDRILDFLDLLPEARTVFAFVADGIALVIGVMMDAQATSMVMANSVVGAARAVGGGINAMIGGLVEAIKATVNAGIEGINFLINQANKLPLVNIGTLDKFGGGNAILDSGLAEFAAGREMLMNEGHQLYDIASLNGPGATMFKEVRSRRAAQGSAAPVGDTSGSGSLGEYGGGGSSGGGGGAKSGTGGSSAAEKAYREQLKETEEAEREAQKAAEDRYNATRGHWDDFVESMKVGHEEYANLAQSLFQGMEDSMVEFVKNGKLDFSGLVDSMISDLTRLAFRSAMTNLFGGSGGLFETIGGFFGAPKQNFNGGLINHPTKFFANGGLASAGEKNVEAIMPLGRDNKGRLGVVASGGGGGDVIHVNFGDINVQSAGGPSNTSEEEGQKMARSLKGEMKKMVIETIYEQKNARRGYA